MASPDQPKLRLKDRRRRLMWVKVASGASVIAISLGLIFYVSHLPGVTVSEVSVTGTNLVSASEVKNIVLEKMKGSYAFLIPRDNAFVLPSSAIASAIMGAFPPVASVSLSRKNTNTLDVAVTERKVAALWCQQGNEASATSSGCYGMDQSGYIFTKAADQPGLVRYSGALVQAPVGASYLGGAFPALSQTVEDIGASISRTPSQVAVDNAGTDVSLTFAEGGDLRFIRTAERQATLENVASVFSSQDFKTHPQFEYVDFRFGDKVYVKFK